jgi:hypothetical protein
MDRKKRARTMLAVCRVGKVNFEHFTGGQRTEAAAVR